MGQTKIIFVFKMGVGASYFVLEEKNNPKPVSYEERKSYRSRKNVIKTKTKPANCKNKYKKKK